MHWRLHTNRDQCFKVSHLCYATHPYIQYQITVKLLGSFRLAAGRRHLHRPCIFTKQIPETVANSLYHSCASELTRQGISLFVSFQRTISSSSNKLLCFRSTTYGLSFESCCCRTVTRVTAYRGSFALTHYNRPSPPDPLLAKRTRTLGRL